MNVELGYALSPPASPGISRESLERLDRHVGEAHQQIAAGVADGRDGYCALDLYDRVDVDAIATAVDALPAFETVVVVGMGGSALGARTVAQALAPTADCYVLDTLDPAYLERVFDQIDLDRTMVHVVSKSGTTVETRAIFALLREAMDEAGVDWAQRTIATTNSEGPLGQTIDRGGATRLEPPAGVPGRYSVLSTMALPSAIALGVDVDGLLAGARRAHQSLAPSLFESPAYAYGTVMAALADRGVTQNAFVPYGEDLGGVAHWFSQLWAESLGKDDLGQTPIPGRGVADHHSQLQRWRAGRREIAITTLSVGESGGPSIPIPEMEDVSVGDLQALERRAVEASLGAAGVPAVGLSIDDLDATALGELFVSLEAATMLVAELWGIDAFDQPAVDWSKSAVRAELGLEDGADQPALEPEESLEITSERRD